MEKREYSIWGQLFAGALFIAGIALFAYLLVSLGRDLSLWVFGEQVEARVVETWVEPYSGSVEQGRIDFRYFLRYQFVTDKGVVITQATQVSPNEWAGLGRAGAAYSSPDPLGPLGGDQSATAPVYHEQAHVPQEFEMGGVQEGGIVQVRYFPLIPSHNSLENTRFIPVYIIGYTVVLILGLFGLIGGWSMLKPRQIANATIWTEALLNQNGSG